MTILYKDKEPMFSSDLGFNPFDKANDANVTNKKFVSLRDKFLKSFGTKHIFCYNGDPRKKISSMNHTDKISVATQANLQKQSDVYFYVNGGRKLYAINEFTCCFCDMDAGRDSEGKYFKPSVVLTKKKKFLEQINNFPVKPTWVVDTRNGYQCYWILDQKSRKTLGKNKTYWNGLQKKLVNYFGGDPRAIKANQIYRVPYTWWRKGWEKKASYFTSILSGSTGKPVDINELQSALTGQSTTVIVNPLKCSDNWYQEYAKVYKNSDATGMPVPHDVSRSIMDNLVSCGQKNTVSYSDPLMVTHVEDTYERAYGVPHPVQSCDRGACLNLSEQQTRLLKTVVEYLNQASTALYFSNNRFLSSAAKDLAAQLGDQFCVG